MKLLSIMRNGKIGFIDKVGNIVIEPEYEHEYIPGHGACLVKNGFRFFMNENNELIKFNGFYKAGLFNCGRCVISKDKKKGYINNYGDIVIQPQYYEANQYKNGYAVVRETMTSNAKLIDINGNCIFEDFFLSIDTEYRVGMINLCIAKNEKLFAGFVNLQKEWIIEPIYSDVYHFSEGLAAVQDMKSKKYGFINSKNDLILEYKYIGSMIQFSEGFSCMFDEGFYFINKNGDDIFKKKYELANNFSDGLALVKKEKTGFINHSGEEVIPCKYNHASDFCDGIASVDNGYINKDGVYIWKNS